MSDMQALKGLLAEWVLTNGTLPTFKERLEKTLPLWSTVPAGGKVVFRGQGGKIAAPEGAPGPDVLVPGIRPLLAASSSETVALQYTNAKCCLFRIFLKPGVRYIHMQPMLTFMNEEGKVDSDVTDENLNQIAAKCKGWSGKWPRESTSASSMRVEVIKRCIAEDEILIYAEGLTFSQSTPGTSSATVRTFEVTLTPSSGGRRRGRTFRRTSKRRNKNGRRSARQSEHHVRDRHPRNR